MSALPETIREIPASGVKWWRDGRTRTAYLRAWEDGVVGHAGNDPVFWHEDETSIGSYHDFKLWEKLGVLSDVLIAFFLGMIVFAILAAL